MISKIPGILITLRNPRTVRTSMILGNPRKMRILEIAGTLETHPGGPEALEVSTESF